MVVKLKTRLFSFLAHTKLTFWRYKVFTHALHSCSYTVNEERKVNKTQILLPDWNNVFISVSRSVMPSYPIRGQNTLNENTAPHVVGRLVKQCYCP